MDMFKNPVKSFTSRHVSGVMGVGVDSFAADVYVPFTPDAIILKSFKMRNQSGDVNQLDLGLMTSDMIDTSEICTFVNYEYADQPDTNLVFQNSKPIQGNYTFNMRSVKGGLLIHGGDMIVAMTFVLVKFS
jgi:hypothetical protein